MYNVLYDLTTPIYVKPTEYTQSGQWPTSGVHSIMMEKSALAGKGGGSTLVTITYKVAVYAPAEMADTLPPFSSIPLYVLCGQALPLHFAY